MIEEEKEEEKTRFLSISRVDFPLCFADPVELAARPH